MPAARSCRGADPLPTLQKGARDDSETWREPGERHVLLLVVRWVGVTLADSPSQSRGPPARRRNLPQIPIKDFITPIAVEDDGPAIIRPRRLRIEDRADIERHLSWGSQRCASLVHVHQKKIGDVGVHDPRSVDGPR